jgi:signal transduction histidine kinase
MTAEKTGPGRSFSRTEQIEQYHKDGHPVWIEATITFLRDRDGNSNGILMISRDVTDRRHIEQMKSDFVTTAAHQLRTPLTPILGFSELLLVMDDLTVDERVRYLGYIRKNAQTMSDIINDLLDISRIESGEGMPLRPQALDLHETIEEIVAFYGESSSVHQIETTLPAGPIEVFADKYKITKLFRNLLDNAVKYSPAGGPIRLTCESFPEHHLFTVADEGVGMDPEQVKRVFDPFFRVEHSDTAVPGTGLGMTVARNIVEGQGGRIWVDSARSRGTTVWFTLPMRPPKYCE